MRSSFVTITWLGCTARQRLLILSGFFAASTANAQQLPNPDDLFTTPATQPADHSLPIQALRQVQIDPALRAAATQLDDPSFAVREDATRQLMDKAADTAQLYAMLAGDGLTPEQRYRLLAILRERLVNSPRGAIGIRMDGPMPNGMPQVGPMEVRVAELLPGLPAERVLQIGDRITAVDGRTLTRSDELINYVQLKQPGEKVMLSVKRTRLDDHGKIVLDEKNQPVSDSMQVELALGNAELLRTSPGQFSQGASLVERARADEARKATNEFSPKPRTVTIQGEESITTSGGGAGGAGAQSRTQIRLDPAVERYWAIQALQLDQQLIREGRKKDTPELRAQWITRWQYLVELAQQPERSNQEREFLQRVVERFAQLISPPNVPGDSH